MNFKGVEKLFFLSCCLQDKALKLVSETFWGFWLCHQPCFRLPLGTADYRGRFGLWPGWAFSTCRMMPGLGVFDYAFLFGFVLVGVF